jgi:hypothetical protein
MITQKDSQNSLKAKIYIRDYGLFRVRIQTKISQGKKNMRQRQGKGPKTEFLVLLSPQSKVLFSQH